MRRTRIVATLGPATDAPGILEGLLAAGLNVARLNLSHGEQPEHLARARRFRAAAEAIGAPAALLVDLPGPKLRVRLESAVELVSGQEVAFSARQEPRPGELAVTEPECIPEVQPGQRILLDDGRLQLMALRAESGRLVARVTVGGTLKPNKGVNLPDTDLPIPAVTDRDRELLSVAATVEADWLALSFVRGPAAADELRAAAKAVGWTGPVLAKVERPEAVRRAAAVVAAFDGVMVARGDLGVETPLEEVPGVQKRLIALARAAGKPVITATDMLDSMRMNPRPTRAEASDVANAIFDGTDAVMLSGETAVGSYPVDAVAFMDRIARAAEAHMAHEEDRFRLVIPTGTADDYLTQAACTLAADVGAAAIITPTLSGRTARHVSRHRPGAAIVAPTPNAAVRQRMALTWGVRPVLLEDQTAGADRLAAAVRSAYRAGTVSAGDLAVVLANHPVESGSRWPTIRLVRVGEGGSSAEP